MNIRVLPYLKGFLGSDLSLSEKVILLVFLLAVGSVALAHYQPHPEKSVLASSPKHTSVSFK